ncbi:serine hydrolase [Alicyclobacillus sp. SO9]|uniref:serine hydrolase n=1 Tax=Alicyclobacillus sp. SO9 TaxID=2665646 RepID=UPI0018E7C553|nr:serine hydrolase [Alicyclobacillus sp. SO9]QQE77084.1 serine hydrolase [Alicyclobacillus sp. SO9]
MSESNRDALSSLSNQDKEKLDEIQAYLQNSLDELHIAGTAVAIVKDGNVILQEGFGLRDVEQGLPVTKDTLFAIGSSTKAFTTTSLAMLVDDGKLEWDAPVSSYLPEFELHDKYASEHATLRDLATHRVGLPRHDLVWYKAPISRQEILKRLRYLPFTKPFRTTFQYQNMMYMTLGYLVGKVSGEGWEHFVKSRVLTPLGMHRTNFSVNQSQQDADFAKPYKFVDEEIQEMPFANLDALGPAGSINSSVSEMIEWVKLHLGKGKHNGSQLVSENNVVQMHTPHIPAANENLDNRVLFQSYALGWFTEVYGGRHIVHHGGNIDGFSAIVAMVPEEQLGVVVLTNQQQSLLPRAAAYTIFDKFLGLTAVDWNGKGKEYMEKIAASMREGSNSDEENRVKATHPSHTLTDYVGEFAHPAYGVVSVTLDNETLLLSHHSQEKPLLLEHFHYDVFAMTIGDGDTAQQYKVQFHTDVRGTIASLYIQFELLLDAFEFVRKPSVESLSREVLNQYVGTYDLNGADVTVALRKDDTLVVTVPGQPAYELVPVANAEFDIKALPGFSVQFVMDDSGVCSEVNFKQPNGTFVLKRR